MRTIKYKATDNEVPPGTLPAPRLQLRWVAIRPDWKTKCCYYELVLPLQQYDIRRPDEVEFTDDPVEMVVELGSTNVDGGGMPMYKGEVATPFRDGAHAHWDSAKLGNLPIYAICGCVFTAIKAKVENAVNV